jgi:hypothetical protein
MNITIKRAGTSGSPMLQAITDPLLASPHVALLRGQAELSANAGLLPVTLQSVYRPSAAVGDLIEVHDYLEGRAWRGVVSSIEIRLDGGQLTMTQQVERL